MTAKALGKLGDEQAINKLIDVINSDSSSSVITASLLAVGEILRDKKEFSKLSSIIEKTKEVNESVHRAAAVAIGNIKDINGILPLIKLLNPSRKETSPEGREEILAALQKFTENEILESLIKESNGDENILLDLIEEALFHFPLELLTKESQSKKENLISKYQRQFRKVKTEIDGINGFVAEMFKSLAKVTDPEDLQTLIDTIPRKRKSLDRIDLEKIAKYNWVKKELYENLKEAQQWHSLGHGALNEFEEAVKLKMNQ